MSRFFLGAALATLAACGRPDPDPGPPPAIPEPSPGEVAAPPEPAVLELPFPSQPPLLRWDFSPARVHGYYVNRQSTTALGALFLDTAQRETVTTREEGRVNLRGGTDRVAQADFKLTPRHREASGKPQDVNRMAAEHFTVEVSETGGLTQVHPLSGDPDPFLLAFLFPLPPGPPDPGPSFERRLDLPAQPGRHARTGTIRTTLSGYAKVDQYECARLVSELDLSLAVAAPAEGQGRVRGRIVSYFACQERRFVHVSAVLVTSLRTRTVVTRADGSRTWSVGEYDETATVTARIGS